MKRYIKSTVAALLVFAIVLSTYIPVIAVGESSNQPNYSTASNSGTRNVTATTLNNTGALSYYGDNYSYDKLSTQSPATLENTLRTLLTSTHNKITSYDDCRDYVWETDCENNNTSRATTLYTSHQMKSSEWAGTWSCNREHVWPQSLGGDNTRGGGADLHHIRPAEASVNSSRGNKKYGYGSGMYVPADNVKGDVARIILYVWIRWDSAWGATDVTKVFQNVDVLLEWCEIDPVDTWEMGRNEVVQRIQGNRNVFIDYPEYAWLLFGREVPDDMTTPSGKAAGGSGSQGGTTTPGGDTTDPGNGGTTTPGGDTTDPGNGGTTTPGGDNTGNDDPVVTPDCSHSFTIKKNAVAADCYNDGYTGDVCCAKCNKVITQGKVISSSSVHKYTEWEMNDDGVYEKHCTLCNKTVEMSINGVISSIDSDAKKILILLALGVTDSQLLDALAKQ